MKDIFIFEYFHNLYSENILVDDKIAHAILM